MVERVKVEAKLTKPQRDGEGLAIQEHVDKAHGNNKYNPKLFPRTAKYLAQRGAIQSEIADCFGVSTRALQHWLTIYPELREAVDAGNESFDTRVERALAERAIGFFVDVATAIVKDKKTGRVSEVTERRYFPPDVTAQIFFLKNRMPSKYRDVQRHEVANSTYKTAAELTQALVFEFKDLIDQGLLRLPAPERKMRDINPRGNGHG